MPPRRTIYSRNSFYDAVFHGLLGREDGQRALFMFMVDQSEAMAEPWGGRDQSKLVGTLSCLNRMLIDMCRSRMRAVERVAEVEYAAEGEWAAEGEHAMGSEALRTSRVGSPQYIGRRRLKGNLGRPVSGHARFPGSGIGLLEEPDGNTADLIDVGFIGYSDRDNGEGAESLWIHEPASGEDGIVRSIAQLSNERQRRFIDAALEGGRPLPEVLARLNESVNGWVERNRVSSFPPVVINISSGAKPLDDRAADELIRTKRASASDKPPLFFNCILTGHKARVPLLFPSERDIREAVSTTDQMTDIEYMNSLYRASSPMPPVIGRYAREFSRKMPHIVALRESTGFALARNTEALEWFAKICN